MAAKLDASAALPANHELRLQQRWWLDQGIDRAQSCQQPYFSDAVSSLFFLLEEGHGVSLDEVTTVSVLCEQLYEPDHVCLRAPIFLHLI